MIIVKLMGGLGNQMFQYAAARRLALIHNTELKLDLSWLNNCTGKATTRRYELDHLNIAAEIATPAEISRLIRSSGFWGINWVISRFCSRSLEGLNQGVFLESHFRFNPALLDASDNVYLDGYWQSEKYFFDTADIIRKDFVMRREPGSQNEFLAKSITSVQAVSVHVRRGDYVTNPSVSAFHGACPPAYYNSAMGLIVQRIDDPHFFVFSDEIEWCRNNIKSSCPVTYVDHNGSADAHMDLWLMSLCRYHVIANSTLSWWGAWLNPQPDKIVVAPLRWLNDTAIDTSDLMPETWMRIAE